MFYDENFLERYNDVTERNYLQMDECYHECRYGLCKKEGTEYIGFQWYCEEHAQEVIDEINNGSVA